jgi:WhiB family transcriptional regulator, redox-sensing transcriptional regulator
MQIAACRTIVDLEIFFVDQGGSSKAARAVCAQCSVRPQCLQLALDHYESIGVWGETTDPERRHLRRAMKATTVEP